MKIILKKGDTLHVELDDDDGGVEIAYDHSGFRIEADMPEDSLDRTGVVYELGFGVPDEDRHPLEITFPPPRIRKDLLHPGLPAPEPIGIYYPASIAAAAKLAEALRTVYPHGQVIPIEGTACIQIKQGGHVWETYVETVEPPDPPGGGYHLWIAGVPNYEEVRVLMRLDKDAGVHIGLMKKAFNTLTRTR